MSLTEEKQHPINRIRVPLESELTGRRGSITRSTVGRTNYDEDRILTGISTREHPALEGNGSRGLRSDSEWRHIVCPPFPEH